VVKIFFFIFGYQILEYRTFFLISSGAQYDNNFAFLIFEHKNQTLFGIFFYFTQNSLKQYKIVITKE